jgi:tRNA threonylcarbamoyladenosine biosynthesis protein TsaB
MRILAGETSGRVGTIAALHGDGNDVQLVQQRPFGDGERTAASLAPALRSLLADVSWPPNSIGLVAVCIGPGSFTGLRIGVTTAKTFAYAVGAEIIGVNTLEVLAAQVPPSPSPLWAILDAQRQELFAAKFDASERGKFRIEMDTRIVTQESWLAQLRPGDRVTGPALRRLLPRLPAGVVAADAENWQPTAAAVGMLAWRLYRAGQRNDVWKLAPTYYRPSAAEEKRARREEADNR